MTAKQGEDRSRKTEICIPWWPSNQVKETILGFQPMGISRQGSQIAIADYSFLAIHIASIDTKRSEGLYLKALSRIAGVQYQNTSIRLFPDVLKRSGVNRAQTVNFNGDTATTLWVTRNMDHEIFILVKPDDGQDQWLLIGRTQLPVESPDIVIHSMLVDKGSVYTIEELGSKGSRRKFVTYEWRSAEFVRRSSVDLAPWFYGIGKRPGDDGFWLVTDLNFAGKSGLPGIYRLYGSQLELRIMGVWGNGIAFLEDGSALVTRYGNDRREAFGAPGVLQHVPPNRFVW